MSTLRATSLALSGVLFALSTPACTTSTCSRDPDFSTIALGDNGSNVEGNVYYSSPVGGPYAYFPPFRTLTFEHGLAAIPYALQLWLAFTPNGTLAPSAGNMTELRVSDDGGPPPLNEQNIRVYNNTCSDFYLWVVAERSTP